MLPPEVMRFVELKVDEPFGPDGFGEEMEKHIYRRIRESHTAKVLLPNIMKDVQYQLQAVNNDQSEAPKGDEVEEPVRLLIFLFKAKGNKGNGNGNGPNDGKGSCFNCG